MNASLGERMFESLEEEGTLPPLHPTPISERLSLCAACVLGNGEWF